MERPPLLLDERRESCRRTAFPAEDPALFYSSSRSQPRANSGDGFSKDPYGDIIQRAAEVRRRVHVLHDITASLGIIAGPSFRRDRGTCNSFSSTVNTVYFFSNSMSTTCALAELDENAAVRSQLYDAFEQNFAAAVEEMQKMSFFGVLSREEQMAIPVARLSFISSRRNLVDVERNQQRLLARQLRSAWERHYKMRETIAARVEELQRRQQNEKTSENQSELQNSSLPEQGRSRRSPRLSLTPSSQSLLCLTGQSQDSQAVNASNRTLAHFLTPEYDVIPINSAEWSNKENEKCVSPSEDEKEKVRRGGDAALAVVHAENLRKIGKLPVERERLDALLRLRDALECVLAAQGDRLRSISAEIHPNAAATSSKTSKRRHLRYSTKCCSDKCACM